MTRWCVLQALVAGDAAASQQLSRLEEQLGSVSFNLSVLEQQVGTFIQLTFVPSRNVILYVP